MNTLPCELVFEGDLIADATVSAEQMAKMNKARATFRELHSILMFQVIPMLDGGWSNPIATQIELRLEGITFDSSNFLWRNRQAGAAHDAAHVGGEQ